MTGIFGQGNLFMKDDIFPQKTHAVNAEAVLSLEGFFLDEQHFDIARSL